MKKLYTWGGKFSNRNITVSDLINSRGKKKFIQTTATNSEEALAAKEAGFEITESSDTVRFPRRPYVRSGYVVLPKGSPKTKILNKISEKLVSKRAKQSK